MTVKVTSAHFDSQAKRLRILGSGFNELVPDTNAPHYIYVDLWDGSESVPAPAAGSDWGDGFTSVRVDDNTLVWDMTGIGIPTGVVAVSVPLGGNGSGSGFTGETDAVLVRFPGPYMTATPWWLTHVNPVSGAAGKLEISESAWIKGFNDQASSYTPPAGPPESIRVLPPLSVDDTDPQNPIISLVGSLGVTLSSPSNGESFSSVQFIDFDDSRVELHPLGPTLVQVKLAALAGFPLLAQFGFVDPPGSGPMVTTILGVDDNRAVTLTTAPVKVAAGGNFGKLHLDVPVHTAGTITLASEQVYITNADNTKWALWQSDGPVTLASGPSDGEVEPLTLASSDGSNDLTYDPTTRTFHSVAGGVFTIQVVLDFLCAGLKA